MAFTGFPPAGLAFLRDLAEHNDRDWFEAHRAVWDESIVPAMAELCGDLKQRLSDRIPGLVSVPRLGGSIFRLNRDTRFSREKHPFKTCAAAQLWDGQDRHGAPAIYVEISAASVLVSGGIWVFEEAQLDRFRKRLVQGAPADRLDEALLQAAKEGLKPDAGEKLPKPPRGIPPEHPRAELSKAKGLVVSKSMKPGPWLHGPEAVERIEAAARAYVPVHRWLKAELFG